MKTKELCTQFASPERDSGKEIKRQAKLLASFPFLKELYNTVTEAVVILNKQRQIVFFNQSLLGLLKLKDGKSIYGLRPGEAFKCKYAKLNPAGCGTTEFCSACGAAKAILSSLKNESEMQECRLAQDKTGKSLDFLVKTTPFAVKNEQFVVFPIKDISDEKRRRILERIFFHDILNIVFCLQLQVSLFKDSSTGASRRVKEEILEEISKLTEIINDQRMILAAENDELLPRFVKTDADFVIDQVFQQYNQYAKSKGVKIENKISKKFIFKTDASILSRVLGNMVKNAIEASKAGEVVGINGKALQGKVELSVSNPAVMAKEVRLQVFQRSFSTKGPDRGLGTYSMKLLCEKYLKGKVSFSSLENKGTVFTISIPLVR